MGQSSVWLLTRKNNEPFLIPLQDQAHLRNERISLNNLRKGKSVVERFFHRMSTTTE